MDRQKALTLFMLVLWGFLIFLVVSGFNPLIFLPPTVGIGIFVILLFVMARTEVRFNIRRWQSKYLILTPLFLYSSLLLIIVYISQWYSNHSFEFNSDLLPTFIQIEGSILAIIFAVTLLAIQLANSNFSQRFIDFYKLLPEIWIILMIFVLIIIYSSFTATNEIIVLFLNYIPINFNANSAIWMGIFSFFCIFLFGYNMMSYLRLENLVQIFIYKLKSKKSWELTDPEQKSNFYYFQSIFDILKSLVEKRDLFTLEVLLKEIDAEGAKYQKSPFRFLKQRSYIITIALDAPDDDNLNDFLDIYTKNLDLLFQVSWDKKYSEISSLLHKHIKNMIEICEFYEKIPHDEREISIEEYQKLVHNGFIIKTKLYKKFIWPF